MAKPIEIAEHLGVSKDTIRNWIKKSVIPYRRIGKQYKFKILEVDAWVDSGKSAEIELAIDGDLRSERREKVIIIYGYFYAVQRHPDC
jgi:excisionase family DNA binding protein